LIAAGRLFAFFRPSKSAPGTKLEAQRPLSCDAGKLPPLPLFRTSAFDVGARNTKKPLCYVCVKINNATGAVL